jgi:hypothetical protein
LRKAEAGAIIVGDDNLDRPERTTPVDAPREEKERKARLRRVEHNLRTKPGIGHNPLKNLDSKK